MSDNADSDGAPYYHLYHAIPSYHNYFCLSRWLDESGYVFLRLFIPCSASFFRYQTVTIRKKKGF